MRSNLGIINLFVEKRISNNQDLTWVKLKLNVERLPSFKWFVVNLSKCKKEWLHVYKFSKK